MLSWDLLDLQIPFPGCLSSQAKFSCLGSWGLTAHQTLHLNGRKLFHSEVKHMTVLKSFCYFGLSLWNPFSTSNADPRVKPIIKPNLADCIHLETLWIWRTMLLFILYRKRGISGTHFGHLLFLFCSLIIQTGGVSFSFIFQNNLHWATKSLSLAISKVRCLHLWNMALGY